MILGSKHIGAILNVLMGKNYICASVGALIKWFVYLCSREPLVPDPSTSEVELAIDKPKGHKSPGIDQITAELIKAGGRTMCLEIHKLITSIWKKEKLPEEWKEAEGF